MASSERHINLYLVINMVLIYDLQDLTDTNPRSPIILADDFNRSNFIFTPSLPGETSKQTHNFATWIHTRNTPEASIIHQTCHPVNDPLVSKYYFLG